ncbi:hypothetical protein CBS147343_186 [Aspergillus niger]|nr:hypothetical protein CBS12448_739 [Aspergillus niger]KAI2923662.1 hypothetical protein CBS147371_1504 [Aspergillus niger]KAI2935002.1 hypothetical protein CBS147320_736 [Aspergillus niger]KAI2953623.1 hypothetical protein CBS147321_467 [Aspergillus niger]KAI2960726.1 hypothetical protein CBS147322_691 [Aspergillus niger]
MPRNMDTATLRYKWFSQGEIGPRSIIKLNNDWVVQQAISEHTFQKDHDDHLARRGPSWTAIRLLVEDRSARTKAYMRTYKQLMHGGTEAEPARVRTRQANSSWCPVELKAYRSLPNKRPLIVPRLLGERVTKQDASGWVPDGFLIYIVWEIVPGIQLGDPCGSKVFWTLERAERDLIREKFKEGYMKLYEWGFDPRPGCGQNLVWNAKTSTLYFVGWFLAYEDIEKKEWTPRFWYFWDLVRAPEKRQRHENPDDSWMW